MFWLCDPSLLPPLVLASASPRRRELLSRAGLHFITAQAELDETPLAGETPANLVERLARQKAETVAAQGLEGLVLGADTVVVLEEAGGGQVLGKPAHPEEARAMLAKLSGRWHTVYTGWSWVGAGRWAHVPTRGGHCTTRVGFHELAAEQIAAYVASGEPLDKAGAYGIQEGGALLVEALEGDYFNVMGLPLARVCRDLLDGLGIPSGPPAKG